MRNYIKDNTELDLVDLFKYLLCKWYLVILAGVVCSILIGGYKYLTSNVSVNENPETTSETAVDYDVLTASYSLSQAELDSAMQYIYDAINNQNEYFDNSILYRIDGNSAPTDMLGYELVITTDNYSNPSQALYNYYLYGIANGEYLNQLAADIGTEPQYLNELIVVDISIGSLVQPIDDSAYDIDFGIVITINGLDETMCNTIADRISEEVKVLYQNDPSRNQYTIEQMFRTFATVHSNRIINAQQTANNNYDNLFMKLKNYSGYKNNISAPVHLSGNSNGTKSAIKYAAIGFILGVLLVCAILALRYMFDNRVFDIASFKCRYNVSDLGSSPAMIAANIRLSIDEKSTVVFSGTADKTEISALIDSINNDLDGYSLIEASDILNKPDQRLKLRQTDNVVLVEKKKKSQYSAIDEELKVLAGMNKNVVGVILI